jgi:hypothetical protein
MECSLVSHVQLIDHQAMKETKRLKQPLSGEARSLTPDGLDATEARAAAGESTIGPDVTETFLDRRVAKEHGSLSAGKTDSRWADATLSSRVISSKRESIWPKFHGMFNAPQISQEKTGEHEESSGLQKEIAKLRAEAVLAAREALDDAERDVRVLRERVRAEPLAMDLDPQQMRRTKTDLSEWLSSQYGNICDNEIALTAVQELTRALERVEPTDITIDDIDRLQEAIESLRQQIDIVERHALSPELAEAYKRASLSLRWKLAASVTATMAGIGAGGGSVALRIFLAALAGSATTAVWDEIRDWATRRSRQRSPVARLKEANKRLVFVVRDLCVLLGRRAQDTPPPLQKGELEVMRTARLAAELWATNAMRRVSECEHWLSQPEYLVALTGIRELLAAVDIVIKQSDFTNAQKFVDDMRAAVEALEENLPPD